MEWRRYLGTAAVTVAGFVLMPAGSALATPVGDCSTVSSVTATPVTCTVTGESDLASILEHVDSAYASYTQAVDSNQTATLPSTTTIEFSNAVQLTSELPFVNGPVVIDGDGYSLTSVENAGVPEYRGFLLYNSLYEAQDCGNSKGDGLCDSAPGAWTPVTIENLTIADTAAQGGAGGAGAGGGAGLGGAIFVGHGVALTLSGDSLSNNSATGGSGGLYNDPTFGTGGGGGGGMGGAGGNGAANGYAGGGGGLGAGASGGDGSGSGAGGSGIAFGLESGGWGDDGTGVSDTGQNPGGSGGGGGGGGGSAGAGAGGGGLSAGGDDTGAEGNDGNSTGSSGGVYGIGGGGGGGFNGAYGGLGGGQGFPGSQQSGGEPNGFGGGAAGASYYNGSPGGYATTNSNQGFAAGGGTNNGNGSDNASDWMGGGGAGIGGAVFVQMGATVAVTGTLNQGGATVTGGSGACATSVCAGNGQGLAGAIFLQGNGSTITVGAQVGSPSGSAISFSPGANQTQTIANNVDDEHSFGSTYSGESSGSSTPWTVTLSGAGTLDLEGSDRFGSTVLNDGTLVLPTSASLASNVTINSGATMILAGTVSGNVTLNAGGTLCAGQTPSNFTNNGGTVTTGCTTPPTATISAPSSGGNYSVGQVVATSFRCAAGTNTVLSSCSDSNGASGGSGSGSGTLNTGAAGVYTYTVTATDGDGKTATTAITYTVASPCTTTVQYGLVQLSAACLQPSANADTYSTPGPLSMNGLTLPALPAGAEYLATEPTTANPGGTLSVQAPSETVDLPLTIGGSDGVTFDLGAFTWNLPAAPAGGLGSANVKTLTLAPAQLLKGMKLGGGVAMNIGRDSGGYYTSFDFTVDLPSLFKSGPAGNAAGLTGTASVRVDSSGVHFGGLSVTVTNAYIGTLQVKSACFAYLPSGSTVSGCPQPAVPATPLPALSCTGGAGDSWVGSADIVLPTSGAPELSLYGDVTGGSLAGLSAQASGLRVALADDVFLTSVGVSLCLPNSSQPLQVQGNATVSAIAQPKGGYLVNVNGNIGYSDPWQGQPWTLSAGGEVFVGGEDVGQGSASFYGSNYLYFEVGSSLNLANIAELSGYISGWLETQSPYQFNVQGSVQLTIKDVGTFDGSGAVSSVGASGCATVGNISYWTLEKDSDWEWYYPWRVHFVEQSVSWQAGFGYYWGDSTPSVWATSCDIGNYELSTPAGVGAAARAHAAAATTGFRVHSAHAPMAVKINGAGGAPTVELKAPSGRVIAPPAAGRIGERIPGIGMLLENKLAHDTTVLLTSPAKGVWRVIPVSGSVRVTSIATARVVPPPEVTGGAKSLRGGKVGLGVAYSLQPGEQLTLYVSGPRHSQQVLGRVKGKRCPGHRSGPSSQLCEHISFRPTYGPSGKRTIFGAVTNAKRLPVATVKISSVKLHFAKPRATKPVIRRRGTKLEVEWLPVTNASRYVVSLVLSDGRKLSHTSQKVTWTEPGVAGTETVKATLWPVMPDGVIGRSAAVTLKGGQARTGAKPKRG